MKKLSFLILFFIYCGVNAQSYCTLADGNPSSVDNRTIFLPIWGEEMDANQHNQLLYHSDHLQPLLNAQITKITFYANLANESWGGATGTIKLMHTNATTLPQGSLNSTAATEVYTGAVAIVNNTMTFTFSTPFTYTGDNLLIDITTITQRVYRSAQFYGLPTDIPLGCRNGQPIRFFTKITFEYYAGSVQTYTITASNTSGGTISPVGAITVAENQNKRFEFAPDASYILSRVLVDNVENAEALTNSYHVFNNVTADHTIHAEFSPIATTHHTITATASTGGRITPSGSVIVPENENKRFEFTPSTNYALSRVLIDNVENGQALADGYYMFTNVTADHTIHAEFVATADIVVVNDGTNINATLPISTSYMDCSQHVQIIYPSGVLQGLTGRSIKKISYHANTAVETFGGVTGTIKIMHTTAANLTTSFVDVALATEVYSGPIAIADFLLSFDLSTPFTYTGGNLLIDITTTQGEPRNIVFYGTTANNLGRYSFDFEGIHHEQPHSAAPKTTFEYGSTPHTIVASASAGGSITPSGNVAVAENANKRFDFTPNANYKLHRVLVDNVENAGALTNSYYIFNNVTTNHTIHAEFTLIGAVSENLLQNVHVYTHHNTLYIINEKHIPLKALEIIEITGRRVYHSNTVSNAISLDLTKGIYIVRLMSDDAVLNTKIIVP